MFPHPVSGTPKKNSPKRLGLAALYPPGSPEDLGSSDFRVSFVAWVFELELVSLGLLPSPLFPFPLSPWFLSPAPGAMRLSVRGHSRLPVSFPALPGCRPRLWLCAPARPPPSPLPLRGLRASGRMVGRGAEQRLATPPGPAFSRAAADHWALAAPARLLGCAQLQPNSASSAGSSTAPARFQPGSSTAPARLWFFSATPVSPSPREPRFPGCPSLCPSMSRTAATSSPPKSPRPALLTSKPRHTPPPFLSRCPSVCPPPRPPFPSSLQLPQLVF